MIDFIDREIAVMLTVVSRSLQQNIKEAREKGMTDSEDLNEFYEVKISALLKLADAQSHIVFAYWEYRISCWLKGIDHRDDLR